MFDTMPISALTIALNTSFKVAVPPEAPCAELYFERHMLLPACFAHFEIVVFDVRVSAQVTKNSCTTFLHSLGYAALVVCDDGWNESWPVD